MIFPYTLLFAVVLIIYWIIYKLIGDTFALDFPNLRKTHNSVVPQIGGLVFGPLFLIIIGKLGLVPMWYIIGGIISVVLGTADDIFEISWKIKLIIQLILTTYLSYIFWGQFESIIFYSISFSLSQVILLAIFIIWFVGIYNSVNLIDGVDGLAGGFVFIISIGLAFSDQGLFSLINSIFAVILLGFLIFNQRSAKLFMGDAGSLFLGFHVAVLPLLYYENSNYSSSLFMTPFVLIVSYLIADTTRVFFTRLVNKKSPMTADTIHFHHLILQQSGSYLASTGSIYFITMLSVIISIMSFQKTLPDNAMISHIALLLFFILVPPVETYVPFISNAIKPFYSWQQKDQDRKPFLYRTILMCVFVLSLLLSLAYDSNITFNYNRYHGYAIILLLLFCYLRFSDKIVIYVVQLSMILLFIDCLLPSEFGALTKLITTLIVVSYIIFTFERRAGCKINEFSSLDLLMLLITLGGISLYSLSFITISFWAFIMNFAIWFGLRFIFYRTIYFEN